MAYNIELADKVKSLVAKNTSKKIIQKKMFGGTSFLIDGNMCCGVLGNELIVRAEPERYEKLMEKPNTRVFDFSGKPMKGWIVVTEKGCESSKELRMWVKESVGFAVSLPKKKKK